MTVPFNANEVLEMAEQIEKNGAKFYRGAAKKFPQVEKVLLELAAMEDDHLKTFADMRKELSEAETEQQVFDPDNQTQLYLKAMADGHVFDFDSNPDDLLAKQETIKDVLKMALGFEKDSVVFYTGLKDSVSYSAGKDRIQAIIKEELSHIVTLSKKMWDLD